MPELSRSQVLVYGAIAVALLLIGARWVRSSDSGSAGITNAAESGGAAAGEEGGFAIERGGGELVVHVAGAVRSPAVYRLPAGARVTDAIERAGGADGEAALDAINLAAPLADGQQVVVPSTVSDVATLGGSAEGPIGLGTATVEELDTIEGIGPVTAADILAYRDEHGGVASIDQLDEISGIGPTTMDALRDSLQP